MTQMKEQIKAPKIELSDEDIAKVSHAEFKTLVIRLLIERADYGYKIEGKVKARKSEIKENVQGNSSDRKETETQINSLEEKDETNLQPEQNEETRIQKSEDSLTLGQPECSNI